MKIKIIKNFKNAHQARGLAVVIDVLRAFTTSCFVFKNGASAIIPVSDIEIALELSKKNPEFVTIGERRGLKLNGFDHGNSPAEIEKVSMLNKTVILTTSAGTRGILNAVNADVIITGAFVNAKAVANYIRKQNPKIVSFIATNDKYMDNEDIMCVNYIKSYIEGKQLNFQKIKKNLINHPTAHGFLKKPMTKFSKKDFLLSLDLDRFDFILKVNKYKNRIFLEKI